MKVNSRIFFFLLNLFFLGPVVGATTLDGFWLRSCQHGMIQTQQFSAQSTFSDEIFFNDANCKTPLMSFLNSGSSILINHFIDFQFDQVHIVLYLDKLVKEYNHRKVCGKSDWKTNDPVEITGLRCALFQETKLVQVPKRGEKRFGIWKIENSKLFFGQMTQTENGSSPDKRPTEWDPRAYSKVR